MRIEVVNNKVILGFETQRDEREFFIDMCAHLGLETNDRVIFRVVKSKLQLEMVDE